MTPSVYLGVATRTREIGIRMALGADRRAVVGMVLRKGLRLAIGMLIGLALAAASAQLLRSMLLGISTTDPIALRAE
jgi:ABC-type antimicrobial peptide transport system permease subunit